MNFEPGWGAEIARQEFVGKPKCGFCNLTDKKMEDKVVGLTLTYKTHFYANCSDLKLLKCIRHIAIQGMLLTTCVIEAHHSQKRRDRR